MTGFSHGTRHEVAEYVARLPECEGSDPVELVEFLFTSFVRHEEPSYDIALITVDADGRGTSRKPSNFLLNWRRLFDRLPDITVASWSASGGPFRTTIVALYIWNKVWRGSEVQVPAVHAGVLEALWQNSAKRVTIPNHEVPAIVNAYRNRHGLHALSQAEIDGSLVWLETCSCLEMKPDRVWLREWIRRKI